MVDSDGVTLNLCIVVRIWMGYIPTEINTLTIVPPPPPHAARTRVPQLSEYRPIDQGRCSVLL